MDHDELRKVAEAAPQGPWGAWVDGMHYHHVSTLEPDRRTKTDLLKTGRGDVAAYIAALPPDVVLGLLDEIDALRFQRDEMNSLAREVMSTFSERGHPGEPCRRTGWVRDERLRSWFLTLNQEPV